MNRNLLFSFLLLFDITSLANAQYPVELTANINLPNSNVYTNSSSGSPVYSSTLQITASFNYARRQEEIQMGLTTNSLGDLILPPGFSSATPAQQALYLINQELEARAGKNYPGSANVLGIPPEGLESNLGGVAAGHANDMAINGFFGHVGTNGNNPYQRIAASPTYSGSCRNAGFAYSENIYSSYTYLSTAPVPGSPAPVVPFLTAQAIYSWIYRDSGSSWGHRRAI